MIQPDELPEGVYQTLITDRLSARLQDIDPTRVHRTALNEAEAPDRIALHLARQIERQLASVEGKARTATAVALVKAVLHSLDGHGTADHLLRENLVEPPQELAAILRMQPDGTVATINRPLLPLLDSTLLTNAPGEPQVGQAIRSEIESATSIDVVMAFITVSGLVKIEEALARHCERGRRLRVITTTYTNITQRAALDRLQALGAEVRVSYDESSTRLHAKAWVFHRPENLSTAYIGSSNLTHQAQVTGLEWNIRVSAARNRHVVDKMRAVFDTYWELPEFRVYDPVEFESRSGAPSSSNQFIAPIAIHPLPFQARMLELLQLEREQGRHRNLLVSATGTGKTVMAALDYLALREVLPQSRLLFIAHRKEILEQSLAIFRQAMLDASFGELWVGGATPSKWHHVFASVQTLNVNEIERLEPDAFDVVIVDEFHHAAAASYRRVLSHLQPKELLGLTATPERADGESVLEWFDGRIAAELRLWDAINAGYLSPFAYFGIFDGTDLTDVPWKRGRGYDVQGLTNVYTADDIWAGRVIKEFVKRIDDPGSVRALGFCVSVQHAQYMARIFTEHGLPSVAVHGGTPDAERTDALKRLRHGDLRVVFSVDVFNEGVDVPAVDAILMLRPTESAVIFLQQLGRGLRKHTSKAQCTVLDFVGQHRKEFRFDLRYGALLGASRKDVIAQVKDGFPLLPAGCHMELDEIAAGIVLRNLQKALPARWTERVAELEALASRGEPVSQRSFLEHTGLDLEDLYDGNRCFSDMLEAAGLPVLPPGPAEEALRRALGRLLHVDDEHRIQSWLALIHRDEPTSCWSDSERRTMRMLTSQLLSQVSPEALPKGSTLDSGIALLRGHPQALAELAELLGLLHDRIQHVVRPLTSRPDLPLRVHARFSRLEILSAFGHGEGATAATWQSGVFWVEDEQADLFAFTLDKSSGTFSPTTRYRDYAISRDLIHWESQAATRASSTTGQRYQHHIARGSSVHLFARLHQSDRALWYLGPATYVSHEGECPMAVTWRLENPLPGDLFSQFAAAVA